MNREEILLTAKLHRSRARVLTVRGSYELARGLLTDLTLKLRASLAEEDAEEDGSAPSELARALADVYGMLGGVERRAGNLDAALTAYRAGALIEADERFGVVDSYNLTNSIVLSILIHPEGLDRIKPSVATAAETVSAQVRGKRRDQWWAWADYGLLSLLLGDVPTAQFAYDRFDACGPGGSDYQSVQQVLTSLARAVTRVDHGTADDIAREAAFMTERRSASGPLPDFGRWCAQDGS